MEGFGISGMPVIGKKAPARPLAEMGNTSTLLFSWADGVVVHAAVAHFTDGQITAFKNQIFTRQTNFFSLRSWTSES